MSGIDISVLMAPLSAERSIASFRIRSRRDIAVQLRLEAMAWRWEGGLNVLGPTEDIAPTPERFEIAPGAEQIVRVAVRAHDRVLERAYRMFIHEDTGAQYFGMMAALTSEMAPVFVTPIDARAALNAGVERRDQRAMLVLNNCGRARSQILAVKDLRIGALPAPRYLLAGARAEIPLPSGANLITVEAADIEGTQTRRIVPVSNTPTRDFGLSL